MIIQESTFITLIAGYTGIFLGMFILAAVSYTIETLGLTDMMFKNPEINWQTALAALVILVISGMMAGLIPARKAAKVNPIEALHAE
jgi:putative ABC transport system permease protein